MQVFDFYLLHWGDTPAWLTFLVLLVLLCAPNSPWFLAARMKGLCYKPGSLKALSYIYLFTMWGTHEHTLQARRQLPTVISALVWILGFKRGASGLAAGAFSWWTYLASPCPHFSTFASAVYHSYGQCHFSACILWWLLSCAQSKSKSVLCFWLLANSPPVLRHLTM